MLCSVLWKGRGHVPSADTIFIHCVCHWPAVWDVGKATDHKSRLLIWNGAVGGKLFYGCVFVTIDWETNVWVVRLSTQKLQDTNLVVVMMMMMISLISIILKPLYFKVWPCCNTRLNSNAICWSILIIKIKFVFSLVFSLCAPRTGDFTELWSFMY